MFDISQGSAILLVLLVTLLWGSWFQAVKHTGKYPIIAFMMWVYLFSVVITWVMIRSIDPTLTSSYVFSEMANQKALTLTLIICGAMFAVGMQIHLTIVGKVGLILSTSISATCCILVGTVVSMVFGGIPEGTSVFLILLSAIILVAATIVCQYAGVLRDRDKKRTNSDTAVMKMQAKDIGLLIFANAVLITAYPLGVSLGSRTELSNSGFSPFLCIGILVIGSFIGSLIYMSITLTRTKQWDTLVLTKKKWLLILSLAFFSGLFHYGGNVIHAGTVPVISMAIAWPMGNSYHVWSYVWGIAYGEFKGSSAKTYRYLGLGIFLFIAGVLTLSFSIN